MTIGKKSCSGLLAGKKETEPGSSRRNIQWAASFFVKKLKFYFPFCSLLFFSVSPWGGVYEGKTNVKFVIENY